MFRMIYYEVFEYLGWFGFNGFFDIGWKHLKLFIFDLVQYV